jgi:hypothetical protein
MTDMLINWRRLVANEIAAIRPGLEGGADVIEADAAQTTAYRGMSGATRASTIAYVADVGDRGDAEILSAYNAAAGLLQGFTAHEGQPHLALVRGPGEHEAWIILTVPTDYILSLETESAGEKAFLADTLHQDAGQAFTVLVAALRGGWHL